MGNLIQPKTSLVSVVIPTRDSAGTIADCVKSIRSQSHGPIEIILVDNYSTDSTVEIAEKNGALVLLRAGGRSAQKNWGAKLARGEYLYFVDSDLILEPDVISRCLAAIEGVDGVLVRTLDVNRGSRAAQLIASRKRILSYDALNVAVRFVRKDVFDSLGGFDPNIYVGMDTDFHRRFLHEGFRARYSSATEWHLGSPLTLRGWLKRNFYYAPSLIKSTSKHPLYSLSRINPLHTVSAWKKSDARGSDLILVVFLGFLSTITLALAALLIHRSREVPSDLQKPVTCRDYGNVAASKNLV
jgi:glycosyltransferase involved in cell wall biosynthesis